ncbi:MAG: hypothetical protein J6X55_09185, partial [Victivallales bacterium]|nr:hypothetical protein [Victivallales bacterium]
GDCPNDYVSNRIRTMNLRLTSGATAVHSDMLEWHEDETPERAMLQLLNVIFSVPQISVKLEKIPESHRRALHFWLDFCKEHKQTLLHSSLTPHSPSFCYPVIEAESDSETIIAVYHPKMVAPTSAKRTYVVNATSANVLTLEIAKAVPDVTIYDCQGNLVGVSRHVRGVRTIAVPPSGLAVIQ